MKGKKKILLGRILHNQPFVRRFCFGRYSFVASSQDYEDQNISIDIKRSFNVLSEQPIDISLHPTPNFIIMDLHSYEDDLYGEAPGGPLYPERLKSSPAETLSFSITSPSPSHSLSINYWLTLKT
jgi:hypothetical protein